MFFIYQFIYTLGLLIHTSARLLGGRGPGAILCRFGFYRQEFYKQFTDQDVIWVHAVSVGEVMAAKPLILDLNKTYPAKTVLLTTVTETGNERAKSFGIPKLAIGYLPVELDFVLKNFFRRVHPEILILLETEIWPNLIRHAHALNIPVTIVNGRLSEKSKRGYAPMGFFFQRVFAMISRFCLQDTMSADRFKDLGIPEEKIYITGNLKYDTAREAFEVTAEEKRRKRQAFRGVLSVTANEKIIVCGSTHPGEEEMLLDVYEKLCRMDERVRMIIAPRHVHRAPAIESLCAKRGVSVRNIASFDEKSVPLPRANVYVVSAMGFMTHLYLAGDIVFIGGSLVHHGGQNPLEAIALDRYTIFGPHMFNFEIIVRELLELSAVRQVQNKEELFETLRGCLADQRKGFNKEGKSKIVFEKNSHARENTFAVIKDCVK